MSTAAATEKEHGAHDPEHQHDPYLAHHFDTPQQQFDSGKLGIWLFLIQEILFFSGLFCAYAVYRSNHPEVFEFAHRYLDWKLGGINTVVLLCSSLSAAWSVRSAQLGDKKWLVFNICFTILCAFGFLGIKYVEYAHKFHDGLLWGRNYDPHHPPESHGEQHAAVHSDEGLGKPAEAAGSRDAHSASSAEGGEHNVPVGPTPSSGPHAAETGKTDAPAAASNSGHSEAAHDEHGGPREHVESPRNTSVFFSIYFAMTGLHGIHVIAGIIVYIWLLLRALKGEFGPKHFAAIDFAALYWHLVDLVWIYLFPLLYLIR